MQRTLALVSVRRFRNPKSQDPNPREIPKTKHPSRRCEDSSIPALATVKTSVAAAARWVIRCSHERPREKQKQAGQSGFATPRLFCVHYELFISEKARQHLHGLDKTVRRQIGQRVEAMRDDLHGDVRNLKGRVIAIGCAWAIIECFLRWNAA